MSKLIAIWGPPGTGKTTMAVKLGDALQGQFSMHVYTVFADTTTPALPVLFPTLKREEMYSMGFTLSKADILQRDIEACTVTVPNHPDLGYLGYKDGENHFSYPRADEKKYAEFLMVLKNMADAVIVDCTAVPDTLSKVAMANADAIIRMVSPDLKSVCFCSSQLPIMAEPFYQLDNHIIVLNENASDVYSPVYDAGHYFVDTAFTLPYCHDIRLQSFNGDLLNRTKSKKFNMQLAAIIERIVE